MTITPTRPRPPTPPSTPPVHRSPGRLVALMLGLCVLLGSASALATAGLLSRIDEDRRVGDYLLTDRTSLGTDSHALAVEEIDLNGLSGDWIFGRTRLRAMSSDPEAQVFIGIARKDDAKDYLRNTAYATVSDIDDRVANYVEHSGAAPTSTPASADIWVAQSSGTGTQSLTWTPKGGDWTAIIMNADATAGVDVKADVGATVPVFEAITCALWIVGAILALGGALLVALGLVRRRRA